MTNNGRRAGAAQQALDVGARFIGSATLPVWGLASLGLGLAYGSGWWIVTGAAIALIGALLFAGNPLFDCGRR
jgi:hypothetical protein